MAGGLGLDMPSKKIVLIVLIIVCQGLIIGLGVFALYIYFFIILYKTLTH